MIPASWQPLVRAPKNKILVKREGVSETWGSLVISGSYRAHMRTSIGTIMDIHPSVADRVEYCVGDRVALSPTGGIKIEFGLSPTEEGCLWVFGASAVKAIFSEEVPFEQEQESPLRNQKEIAASTGTWDRKWTEGDREGFR